MPFSAIDAWMSLKNLSLSGRKIRHDVTLYMQPANCHLYTFENTGKRLGGAELARILKTT